MSIQAQQIIDHLQSLGNPEAAAHAQGFFKTGKGEYGEGDQFLGIRVPVIRQCVRQYRQVGLAETLELLSSPLHEARLLALLMLVDRYQRGTEADRLTIFSAYLEHVNCINNWDLVDCSAEHIVGAQLLAGDRALLYRLAKSKSLWDRRIAMLSTFHFIKRGDFTDTLAIAELLLHDREDLLHKAAGWMLREVGKRNLPAEQDFLRQHCREMPRTMLRYAIEKFPEPDRQAYLRGMTP
jgi:3-methyladenine DNA glycosylase AlkD